MGTFRCELSGNLTVQFRRMMEHTCPRFPIVIMQFAKINSFGGSFKTLILCSCFANHLSTFLSYVDVFVDHFLTGFTCQVGWSKVLNISQE
jgi:hypothetical protein